MCALFTIAYCFQAGRCVLRFTQRPPSCRTVDATIFTSLILAILFCAVEIALAWLPISEYLAAPLNVLLTIDGLSYIFPTALLYWGIILFLRNYENTLYTETHGQVGERKFYQTIVHALLFSFRVVLAAMDISLKVVLGNGTVKVRPSSSQSEESINYDISTICLLFMVVNVFVSALSLRRAIKKHTSVNTKV